MLLEYMFDTSPNSYIAVLTVREVSCNGKSLEQFLFTRCKISLNWAVLPGRFRERVESHFHRLLTFTFSIEDFL